MTQEKLKITPDVQTLLDQARKARQEKKLAEAAALYDQALTKARELKDRTGEATALVAIGNVYLNTNQTQKALEYYNKALPLYRALGDKNREANVLNNMGSAYYSISEFQKAIGSFSEALPLYRQTEDKRGEALALSNIGTNHAETGQYQKALEFLNQALPIFQATGDKKGEANALNSIGSTYIYSGQYQKAPEFLNKALLIAREVGDKAVEANTLLNLGNVYKDAGQYPKALESYNQSLPIAREIGNQQGEAITLVNLGNIYENTGQYPKALESYNQALLIFQQNENKQGETITLLNLGGIHRAMGQLQKALAYYNKALPLAREIRDKQVEAPILTNLAIVEESLKKPDRAEAHYAQAIALYETLRQDLGGLSEAKTSFLGDVIDAYYNYLTFLLTEGKEVRAFEVAQQTKARSLLDLMTAGRVDFLGELTADEQAQEQALRKRADTLNQAMVKEGVENEVGAKKRYAALKEELRKTESALQTLTDTLYSRHPRLAQKRVAKTATFAGIAKLLPADMALLEYIVLSNKELALFVVTRRGVKALTLLPSYAKMVTKAADFRSTCADPRKDYKPAATELYKLLLAPAAKHLIGVKRLVVCPDGALWDIPFQALLMNGQFLAQRYEISYAYSATGAQAALMVKPGRKKPTETLLAVANPDFGSSKRFGDLDSIPGQRPIDTPSRPIDTPSRPIDTPSRPIDTPSRPIDTPSRPIDSPSRPIDSPSRPIDSPSRAFDSVSRGKAIVALPGTQREADALKKLFPSATLMTGKAAQEAKTKVEASKFRYLHFATHGFFNDASPLLSSLVLAQPDEASKDDGFLTAREIFELDLSAEMVVLSACNTARGVQRTGDGVIGLTWALFVAGCPTQVVSQWAVDDASTATLMTSFYGNLAKGKTGKGAALRQASLSLMQSPKHSHPYYWAPFVLMGDWR